MTPRSVHTTIRHLSSVISRGESEVRLLQNKIDHAYYYSPKLTDAQIMDARRTIKQIDGKLQPVRVALGALADCVGKDLI